MSRILLAYFLVAGGLAALDIYTTYLFLEDGYAEANLIAPIHDPALLIAAQSIFTVLGALSLWFGLKFIHRNDRSLHSGLSAGRATFGNFWRTITTADNGSLSLLALIISAYWMWLKLFCVVGNLVLLLFDFGIYNLLVSPISFLGEALQYWVLFLVMGFVFASVMFILSFLRWRSFGTILNADLITRRR